MEIKTFRIIQSKGLIIAFLLLLLSNPCILYSQTSYQYYYRVYFRDKGENTISGFTPAQLLTDKAIARREKANISALHITDIPVSKEYIVRISDLGLKYHCSSKWMNTALFKSIQPFNLNILLSFPFVQSVKIVKNSLKKSSSIDKLDFDYSLSLQEFDRPLTMINGSILHQSGFTGQNILIAVLDGGFLFTDNASSLLNLRNRKGIRSTYDFVLNNKEIYSHHNHGTSVLSVLAGNIEGVIAGTAPGADFLLLRTEDSGSEFPVEEDFWAAGAEFADSAGADIITSSLGYSQFDDPAMNYKYSDMDGNTAFVTKAADIAGSKGILVFNSAGNERNKQWIHLIAPADGDSVMAVGAVDENKNISIFSSSGPSADGRVKPDNVAMGVAVPVQLNANVIAAANGTSFSCPVLSGITACLMQAVPKAGIGEIINILHSSSDRFQNPDPLYGYGIPDMISALLKLQEKYANMPVSDFVISPNPTTGSFEITFRLPPGKLIIEVISGTGRVLFRQNFQQFAGRVFKINELQHREQGLYVVRLITENGTFVHKVIKINN